MARSILDEAQVDPAVREKVASLAYKYLEYGSYMTGYRRRLALKMWTGWPTLPMVFVKGVPIGGAEDLKRLLASGELHR